MAKLVTMVLDGPMYGLTANQDKLLYKTLLCIMRIPGLFLLDIWWLNNAYSVIPASLEHSALAESGYNLIPLLLAIAILLLPLQELVTFYMHVIAAGAMVRSVFSAWSFPEEEVKIRNEIFGETWPDIGFIMRHVRINKPHILSLNSIILQAQNAATLITATWIIRWCLDCKHPVFREVCPQLYLVPLLASFLCLPHDVVEWLTGVIHGFMAMFVTLYAMRTICNSYVFCVENLRQYEAFRQEVGVIGGLATIIRNMFEPVCLGTYFIVQLTAQLWSDFLGLEEKQFVIQDSDLLVECLVSLSEVCCSPLMLISLSIFVMATSHTLLTKTKELLSNYANTAGAGEPELPAGCTEGIVTFILGLQTGMIELEMPGRIGAVSIIMFVVVASLLQSCLDLTHPVLLSLPAIHTNISSHLIPVFLTLLLMMTPLWMVYTLLTIISSELWTLVIISSCLVTSIQSLGHILTYCIILWDCRQPSPSPNTDDYIFWVKGGSQTLELLMAVIVVSGGFYEGFVEDDQEWSIMNTMVLTCHCYVNIYVRVKKGWHSYLARRETCK